MGKWLVSEGGLEPPRPLRALAPQASASAIPPLGPARPLYPGTDHGTSTVPARRRGRTGHHSTRWEAPCRGAGWRPGGSGGQHGGEFAAPHHNAPPPDDRAPRTQRPLAAAQGPAEPRARVAADPP